MLTGCNFSHGAGNGLLLPYVMRFNMPERLAEFAEIARLLGENVSRLSEAQAAERAIVAVEKLRAMGHRVYGSSQGDAHTIVVNPKTGAYQGAADRRINGKASGF